VSNRQDVPANPPTAIAGAGRPAQRRRTRQAIVAATAALLADGHSPTVDAIATAADVSRRTVYLHFPTLDQLLLDAALGALSDAEVGTALEPAQHGDDVHARVDALARTMLDMAPTTLPLGRQIIRLTVESSPSDAPSPNTTPGTGRRGYRRVAWIESAVEPLRARLSAEQFERLVSALTVALGFESMIALRDIRALDTATERRVTTWIVGALVDAMLAEATP
jgi:AcrR family transcriptional regulator